MVNTKMMATCFVLEVTLNVVLASLGTFVYSIIIMANSISLLMILLFDPCLMFLIFKKVKRKLQRFENVIDLGSEISSSSRISTLFMELSENNRVAFKATKICSICLPCSRRARFLFVAVLVFLFIRLLIALGLYRTLFLSPVLSLCFSAYRRNYRSFIDTVKRLQNAHQMSLLYEWFMKCFSLLQSRKRCNVCFEIYCVCCPVTVNVSNSVVGGVGNSLMVTEERRADIT